MTPGRWIAPFGAEADVPTEADSPWDSRQEASPAALGPSGCVEVATAPVVVPRLATDGELGPPQPAVKAPTPARAVPRTTVRAVISASKAGGSKQALKRL
jgi:hypothetical protein